MHPEVLLIHLICKTYNIHLNLNFLSFIPAEISNILTKSAMLITLSFVYTSLAIFLFLIYNALMYFIDNGAENEKEADSANNSSQFLVECEKEITNLDDTFIPTLLLVFVYGWFFVGSYFWMLLKQSFISPIFIVLPILLLVVMLMPLNIIYDYGLMFASYLRGAGATTILVLELMYDCLATMIMFVRLSVQNIRFFLMFFAFIELFELLYNSTLVKWETLETEEEYYEGVLARFEENGLFYSLFAEAPIFIFRYLYQFLHLLFTIISHFVAYLALVFWLFSFLYTCFVDERFEIYYRAKKDKWKNKKNIK